MIRLTPLPAALAFLLPFVIAYPQGSVWGRGGGRGRCGTVTTAEDLAAIAAVAGPSSGSFSNVSNFSSVSTKRFRARSLPTYSLEPWLLGDITVKTWIHVVAVNETLDGGWIPDDQLAAQMDVLNENYAPNHIQFVLEGITRTVNPHWATGVNDDTELQMKSALRKGDYKTLNIYFQQSLWSNIIGFARYPTTTDVGSVDFNISGPTLLYTTVPGGTREYYNLGKTATHEVGHWMGRRRQL
ncbi:hypothetical protein ONS95_008395 [Cadophora gregata]|uniref:uncharacterized protein n=1 Tax=Cadophora gregata TaxID=51156 RepID=UPI0026DA78EF|nr:uncharacterized protein ONS95_008395 [Cadophora gregata]KAK0126816.1 hypothetical protein ONS95_008395 [Cadophora gregata]